MTQRYKLLGHFDYSEFSENFEKSKYSKLKIYTFKYKFFGRVADAGLHPAS